MGCVSSTLTNHDDDFSQVGGSAFRHHIVSLTSTTYGLLTLDPPSDRSPTSTPTTSTATIPPTPPPRFTLGSLFPSPLSESKTFRSQPSEIINSWELMAGLDSITSDSFRFSPLPCKPKPFRNIAKENSNPNLSLRTLDNSTISKPSEDDVSRKSTLRKHSLDGFEELCPPNGEAKVVVYTTTLRGVRKTFEACNAVRSAIEALGVSICERDISMDRGFREELRELMKGKESSELVPPQVFVKGRYIGGAEAVMRVVEEGCLGDLLQGMPKLKAGYVCEGCGGSRFLPCFQCNGSCKFVMVVKEEEKGGQKQGRTVVLRCSECNENGLVLCPICS